MSKQTTTVPRSASRRRLWVWIVAGGVIASLVALVVRPQSVPVELVAVDRGPLEVSLGEEGETRVRDRFVVSAPLAGRVLRIELEPGDAVIAEETVLATFQPSAPDLLDARRRGETQAQVRAAEAALGQAKAEHERALAELRHAEAEVERTRRLVAEDILSKESLEDAELQLDTLRQGAKASDFRIRTAEHDLEMLRVRLRETNGASAGDAGPPMAIRSPVDGVVLKRRHESESVVPAGEALVEVADPSRLEIVADFLSTDAVRIEPGLAVWIEQWGGDTPLRGKVRRVEPSGFTKISALGVEEQRVNVVIDFEDPRNAWRALGDGFRVEVRVVTWQADDVLRVPTNALFRHQDGWAVFRQEAGLAHLVAVELGHRNASTAEVLSGLDVGDRVIVHPGDSVRDQVRIEERRIE